MPTISDFLKKIPGISADKSKKEVVLAYLLGLAVVFVVYAVFFLKPAFATLIESALKVRSRKTEIRALRHDLPLKDEFVRKNRLQQKKLARFEKKLSKEKELPRLLESLSKMARNSRVKILGITPLHRVLAKPKKGAVKKQSIYQEVPIKISAQSGYHEFGLFLSKLENDTRYMQVSDLKIRANRSDARRHDIEFVVYAYTFKQK